MIFVFKWNSNDVIKHPNIPICSHWWHDKETDLHSHLGNYEFFFLTAGEATHMVNGKAQLLSVGHLCLVRPNEQHGLISKDCDTLHYNLALEASYFENLCQEISPQLKTLIDSYPYPISIKLQDSHLHYFIDLAKSYDLTAAHPQPNATILKNLVLSILLDLHAFFPETTQIPIWFQSFLAEINAPSFISKTVNDAYTLAPCAPSTLIDCFHKYLNCTPSQYLVKKKILYACSLLKSTNFTVLHIANELGFSSLSHFNKIFKKETGLPPSRYRKLYLPNMTQYQ